ncbi:MAG: riboflavin biosynthesis protein RibF [Clostridia bacterium]|nr:riboflavin biosynthesis protein RibF [Clostridia bacterium]
MKTAIALGTFDGVHIAHRVVLSLPSGYKKVAVTFAAPPKMEFENNFELLMPFSKRKEILKNLGFEEIEILEFCEVKNTEPIKFLEFLFEKFKPSVISCGFNYRFGKNGKGDTELLKSFCEQKGIECRVCEAVKKDGQIVSSTAIRTLLKKGEIQKANELLESEFSFTAKVQRGNSRGRTIGFPTINQRYPEDLVKIKFGVYKTKVLFDGNVYNGITNIGIRPTFESEYIISETFIKDFSGDLYGREVEIIPQKFLRQEIKFASLEELKKQIEKDIN